MSVPPPPTSPRPSALRSLLLLAAVLVGLVVVRWSVTGGLSRPLAPPAQPRVHAPPAPPAGDLAGLRGALLYMGGRQVLAVDAASGTISSIPSPGAGRVRVLRQGEYLILLARDGGTAAQRADLKSKPVLLGDAIDVLPSPRSDRVWLVSQDETAPEQAYVLREVELTSNRKLRRWTLPYDAEPVAVVPQGVVIRDLQNRFEVRDPHGRRIVELGHDLTFLDRHGPAWGAASRSGPSLRTRASWRCSPSWPGRASPGSRSWTWPAAVPACCPGPAGRRPWPASRASAGATPAGCSSSTAGRRSPTLPPGGQEGRPPSRWRWTFATSPPSCPAVWRRADRPAQARLSRRSASTSCPGADQARDGLGAAW